MSRRVLVGRPCRAAPHPSAGQDYRSDQLRRAGRRPSASSWGFCPFRSGGSKHEASLEWCCARRGHRGCRACLGASSDIADRTHCAASLASGASSLASASDGVEDRYHSADDKDERRDGSQTPPGRAPDPPRSVRLARLPRLAQTLRLARRIWPGLRLWRRVANRPRRQSVECRGVGAGWHADGRIRYGSPAAPGLSTLLSRQRTRDYPTRTAGNAVPALRAGVSGEDSPAQTRLSRAGSSVGSRAGSKRRRSTLPASPSVISSAIASPVAGALRMPQTLWPVAT
jgi:hypothetical protein